MFQNLLNLDKVKTLNNTIAFKFQIADLNTHNPNIKCNQIVDHGFAFKKPAELQQQKYPHTVSKFHTQDFFFLK